MLRCRGGQREGPQRERPILWRQVVGVRGDEPQGGSMERQPAEQASPSRPVLVHFTVGHSQETALFRTDTPDDQLKGKSLFYFSV